MHLIRTIFQNLLKRERIAVFGFFLVLAAGGIGAAANFIITKTEMVPAPGGSWMEGIAGQPTIVNPVFSSTEADQALSSLVYGTLKDLVSDYKEEKRASMYSITLKENLFWSDGKPLTSDDVVYTIETIQNPDMRSPLFKNWQGIVAERVSELQVKFTLPSSYVFFGENLRRLQVIPKHVWGTLSYASVRVSPYALEPVGSGPYSVRRIQKGSDGFIDTYRLVENPYFAGKKPYIKNFSVSFFQNEETLHRAWRSGSVNGFGSAIPLKDPDNFTGRGAIEEVPMFRYYAVFWNPAKNPALKDKDLRLALDRATPKEEIKREVFGDRAIIIDGPVLQGSALAADAPDTLNLETAREFFQKSKEEGVVISLAVPDTSFLRDTAEILKRSWETIGIKEVKIIALDPTEIFESVIKSGNYEAILFGNILENPEDLFSFWHSSQRGYPGLNLANYSNKNVDRLLEEVRTSENEATRSAKLQSLELFLTGDAPAVFLYSLPYFYVHERALHGFGPQGGGVTSPADRFRNVAEWYIAEKRVITQ